MASHRAKPPRSISAPLAHPHTGEALRTWFFVMTLCHSRHQYAEVVFDQAVATWLACHRRAFEWFGVPKRNPKCAITRACHTDPTVQRAYAECAEGLWLQDRPLSAARVPRSRRCQPAVAGLDPR